MVDQLPGILIGLWAVASFWIVGNGRRSGWMLALISEVGWTAYALWLQQYGLLITVGFFTPVYLRNWIKWAPAQGGGDTDA